MGVDNIIDFGPVEDKMQGIIKVIGVGGGGEDDVMEVPKQPTMIERWKRWLNDLMKDVTE